MMSPRRHSPALPVVCISLLSLCGCAEYMPASSDFVALPDGRWSPEMTLDFDPWPLDSAAVDSRPFALRICLRHQLPCQNSAEIIVEQEAPDLPLRCDTLRFPLLDPSGRPLGNGGYGVYTVESSLPAPVPLPDCYSVSLRPLDTLFSVSAVGVLLSPLSADTPK